MFPMFDPNFIQKRLLNSIRGSILLLTLSIYETISLPI